jgi:cation transport regulator ChaB
MPERRDDLPSTVQRSPAAARRTFSAAHDAAVQSYGEGERAHRTAFAALKHSFEKVGDHWEPKLRKGPSDAHAAGRTRSGRPPTGRTAEGVDANPSKSHLMDVARRLDIAGRSRMSKAELVQAIAKANRGATRKARARR